MLMSSPMRSTLTQSLQRPLPGRVRTHSHLGSEQELLALEERMGSVAIAPSAVTVDQLPTHPFSSAQLRRTAGEGGELDEQLTTYVTHRPLNMAVVIVNVLWAASMQVHDLPGGVRGWGAVEDFAVLALLPPGVHRRVALRQQAVPHLQV